MKEFTLLGLYTEKYISLTDTITSVSDSDIESDLKVDILNKLFDYSEFLIRKINYMKHEGKDNGTNSNNDSQ